MLPVVSLVEESILAALSFLMARHQVMVEQQQGGKGASRRQP